MDGPDIIRFDKALEMLDRSISELHDVACRMVPDSLMRYGLRMSIEGLCRDVPTAKFQYYGENPRLDSRLEMFIYHCACELVANAVKHAGATIINVQLMVNNGLVSLTVRDNGYGFDPGKVTSGIGLENIRIRTAAYNGKMNIHTAPGNGTEISIELEKGKVNNEDW